MNKFLVEDKKLFVKERYRLSAIFGLSILLISALAGCDNQKITTSAKEFEQCLDSSKFDSQISTVQNMGVQMGVRGTPTSFINGYMVNTAATYDMLKEIIDPLLAGNEPTSGILATDDNGKIIKVKMPEIEDKDHQRGAKDGKIKILIFSDYECSFCAIYEDSIAQVLNNYPNDVTIVFKHFPLNIHLNAKNAAIASECAGLQDKFWEMHDKLFELNKSKSMNLDSIKQAAVDLGLK